MKPKIVWCPASEQKSYYDKLVIPESRKLMWSALKKSGKVDFKKAHAPLLFVAGTEDHIMPASLNRKTYKKHKKYQPAGSITDFKEFARRNHLAMSQANWKEDADFILDWIQVEHFLYITIFLKRLTKCR